MIYTSKKYRVNLYDILQGLIMAVGAPVLTIIYESIEKGSLEFDWKHIILAGLGGGIAYLIKKFFTPSSITIKPAEAVEVDNVKPIE